MASEFACMNFTERLCLKLTGRILCSEFRKQNPQ